MYTRVLHIACLDVIAVSSIDYGLYLLQLNVNGVDAQADLKLGEQHRYRKAVYGTDFESCPSMVERRTCVPTDC